MGFNRRQFIKALGAATATFSLAPHIATAQERRYWPRFSNQQSSVKMVNCSAGYNGGGISKYTFSQEGEDWLEVPKLYADGVHDDTAALLWYVEHHVPLPMGGTYRIATNGLTLPAGAALIGTAPYKTFIKMGK